jgi:hypothetical protein
MINPTTSGLNPAARSAYLDIYNRIHPPTKPPVAKPKRVRDLAEKEVGYSHYCDLNLWKKEKEIVNE